MGHNDSTTGRAIVALGAACALAVLTRYGANLGDTSGAIASGCGAALALICAARDGAPSLRSLWEV